MSGPRTLEPLRRRMGTIVDIGSTEDFPSRAYDIVYTLVIFLNLGVTIAYTFDTAEDRCGALLLTIEEWTVAYFAVDWALRVWTAKYRCPDLPETRAILKYLLSFGGIVDILSFLPYYLPWFFPAGAVAFRMFRVVRIFRLFRINAYYDSLNVITQVLASKAQQLLSSVFIILVLMTASSLCMYSLEHDAQPVVFSNAFSASGGLCPRCSPWATATFIPLRPWERFSAYSSRFLASAWWPSPPASFPPALWTSIPASSASANTARPRTFILSASI